MSEYDNLKSVLDKLVIQYKKKPNMYLKIRIKLVKRKIKNIEIINVVRQ